MISKIITPNVSKLAPVGGKPATQKEWDEAQKAMLEVGYRLMREAGVPRKQARELADGIYGGNAGRMMLEMAFGSDNVKPERK